MELLLFPFLGCQSIREKMIQMSETSDIGSTVTTIRQNEIYKALKIKLQPLKSVYAKIPSKISKNKNVVMKNNS